MADNAERARRIAPEIVAGRHFFMAEGVRAIAIDDARALAESFLALAAELDATKKERDEATAGLVEYELSASRREAEREKEWKSAIVAAERERDIAIGDAKRQSDAVAMLCATERGELAELRQRTAELVAAIDVACEEGFVDGNLVSLPADSWSRILALVATEEKT